MSEPDRTPLIEASIRYECQHPGVTAAYIQATARWDCIMRCWTFIHAGMMLGVELDGSIHS